MISEDGKSETVGLIILTNFVSVSGMIFSFKLDDGESLHEVQTRNVTTLNFLLKRFPEKHLAVGSHGTALSTIINYYDKRFGYNEFRRIKNVMPWIVQFDFEGMDIKSIQL